MNVREMSHAQVRADRERVGADRASDVTHTPVYASEFCDDVTSEATPHQPIVGKLPGPADVSINAITHKRFKVHASIHVYMQARAGAQL